MGSSSRSFNLYVPHGRAHVNSPAAFLFHGYGATPSKIDKKASFIDNAQDLHWYAVLPFGSGLIKGWNGAGCCPGVFSDDVTFTRAIVDWLNIQTCVDNNKIYATGFSNGGFMTHRLACEASDVFAGFSPHSGLMGKDYSTGCVPANPVPIVSFHGTADGVVPYFGNGNYLSFWDTMTQWAIHNDCGDAENAVDVLITDTTHCMRYNGCAGGVPVEFCEITGLAHDWSGNDPGRPADVDATPYIFQFFQQVSLWTDQRLANGVVKKPQPGNLAAGVVRKPTLNM